MVGRQGLEAIIADVQTQYPGAYWMDQFDNLANMEAHYRTTGPEIWQQLRDMDAFVMAPGTGGVFSGVVKYLKEQNPSIRAFLGDPVGSSLKRYVDSCGLLNSKTASSIAEGTGPIYVTNNMKVGLPLAEMPILQVREKSLP
jgi:cysteine synthase A